MHDGRIPACSKGNPRGSHLISARLLVEMIFLTTCVIATPACHQPAPNAAPDWSEENRASADGVEAVLRVSSDQATVGTRIDVELEVQAPVATKIAPLEFQPSGLEPVDFVVLPVTLGDDGRERSRFRWVFQAGAPQSVAGRELHLAYAAGGARSRSLIVTLPTVVIRSVFAPGKFADTLPPLEESDAL